MKSLSKLSISIAVIADINILDKEASKVRPPIKHFTESIRASVNPQILICSKLSRHAFLKSIPPPSTPPKRPIHIILKALSSSFSSL